MVLNSRRLTEDLGWSASGNPSLYLGDAVHYTHLGSETLASVEVAALTSIPEPAGLFIILPAIALLLRSSGRQQSKARAAA